MRAIKFNLNTHSHSIRGVFLLVDHSILNGCQLIVAVAVVVVERGANPIPHYMRCRAQLIKRCRCPNLTNANSFHHWDTHAMIIVCATFMAAPFGSASASGSFYNAMLIKFGPHNGSQAQRARTSCHRRAAARNRTAGKYFEYLVVFSSRLRPFSIFDYSSNRTLSIKFKVTVFMLVVCKEI